MRKLRFILIAAIAVGLAPGMLLRTPTTIDRNAPYAGSAPVMAITNLIDDPDVANGFTDHTAGALTLDGAWELTSQRPFFGGFSALVATSPDLLRSGSDRGWMLDIPLIDGDPQVRGANFTFYGRAFGGYRELVDLEALTYDPASQTLWAAYESYNLIQSESVDGERHRRAPPEMREWSANSGAESLVRLKDGSFITLREGHDDSDIPGHPGLWFDRDPVEESVPTPFRVLTPEGFVPVDATQMPDGTVLILLRRVRYTIPATFDAAIMRADPSTIARDAEWRGEVIANLDGEILGENFEGIAFVPDKGPATNAGSIYLVADDNLSIFQRSLLVRLHWLPQ